MFFEEFNCLLDKLEKAEDSLIHGDSAPHEVFVTLNVKEVVFLREKVAQIIEQLSTLHGISDAYDRCTQGISMNEDAQKN